jgi:hypothetical protein
MEFSYNVTWAEKWQNYDTPVGYSEILYVLEVWSQLSIAGNNGLERTVMQIHKYF